jgi:hypothetical protein
VSGYAVSARIGQARPKVVATFLVAASAHTDPGADRAGGPAASSSADVAADLADTAVNDDLVDRVAAFRERWSQLTFYLFDADGWR